MFYSDFFPTLLKRAKFRKIFLILLVFSLFLGSLVVPMEKGHPGANITNYFDALWWTTTTITTVGYGDFVPVTHAGKILGMILQFFGVSMYGSLIAMMGRALNKKQDEYYQTRVIERLDRIENQLKKLDKESEFLIKKPQ